MCVENMDWWSVHWWHRWYSRDRLLLMDYILGGRFSWWMIFSWDIILVWHYCCGTLLLRDSILVGWYSRGIPFLADAILVAQYSCGVLFLVMYIEDPPHRWTCLREQFRPMESRSVQILTGVMTGCFGGFWRFVEISGDECMKVCTHSCLHECMHAWRHSHMHEW